jgi:hypothetical protein
MEENIEIMKRKSGMRFCKSMLSGGRGESGGNQGEGVSCRRIFFLSGGFFDRGYFIF